MLLQYQIGVIGEASVARALSGIEKRLARHNANVNRLVAQTARTGGGRASGGGAGSPIAQARKESAALEREQRKQQSYWERANRKSIDQRLREQERAHRAEVRMVERAAKDKVRAEERAARQTMASRRRFSEGTFGRIGSSVGGTLKATGALAGTALGLGGGFAVAGAVQTQSREAAKASQLANQAGNPALKGQLLKESRNVRGFTGEEALAGMEEFVTKTGDLDTARKLIGSLGQLSLATGANLGDLGATAGQAFTVLADQISDPEERVRQLTELMKTLAQQGAMGAVEIRDLAQDFGKLGAATRAFEGDAPALLRGMGAFAQIAVRSGGAQSSADAATAASRLSNDIVMHKDRFKKLGVDIKSKNDPTKLRDPMEIMADTLDKTGGDVEKTAGLLGLESVKIFRGLGATYSAAEQKKKGSGRDAIMAEFQKYAGATLSDKDVNARADSRLSDSDLQFKEAMKDFNTRVGTELLPTLTRMIPEFSKLLPYVEQAVRFFGRLAEAFAQDPIGGVAKLVAAKLALDLAISGVADAGKKLSGALGSATAGMGGGAVSGALGAAGTGAALGISMATFIVTTGIFNFEKREADIKAAGANLNAARELAAKGDVEGVRKLRETNEKMVTDAKTPGVAESLLSGAFDVAQFAMNPANFFAPGSHLLTGVDTSKNSDAAASWITSNTIDQSRDTAIKSIDPMVEQMRALELAAESAAKNLAKLSNAPLNRTDAPSTPVR